MVVRFMAVAMVCLAAAGARATEPQLAPELQDYAWMVGDWAAEKVWLPATALHPNRYASASGNPNVKVAVIEEGKALRIEYAYRVWNSPGLGEEFITYRHSETLRSAGAINLKISGELVRTEGTHTHKSNYEFQISRFAAQNWVWPGGDENHMNRVAADPRAADVVMLICRRDVRRSNPDYVPFTPKSPQVALRQ